MTIVLGQNPTPAAPKPTGDLTESVLGARLRVEDGKVIVTHIKRGGRADKAGIRPGDQLDSIEKRKLTSMKDVLNVLAHVQPGHGLVMSVVPKAGPRRLYFAAVPTAPEKPTPSGAMLGATLSDSSAGVLVGPLSMGGPAVVAGIRSGDVIVSVNGQGVNTRAQILAILNGENPGDRIDLVVERGGWKRTLPVTLDSKAQVGTLPKMAVPPPQAQQAATPRVVNQEDPNDEWADAQEAEDIYNVNDRALYTDFD